TLCPLHDTIACEKVLPGPFGGNLRRPSNSNELENNRISPDASTRKRPSCVGTIWKLEVALDQSCVARSFPVLASSKNVRNGIGAEGEATFPACALEGLTDVANVSARRSSSTKLTLTHLTQRFNSCFESANSLSAIRRAGRLSSLEVCSESVFWTVEKSAGRTTNAEKRITPSHC